MGPKMSIQVRQLTPQDADELFRLRQQALRQEPFAFLSSPQDDLIQSTEAMREHLAALSNGSCIFGALSDGSLVGMVGLARDKPIKAAHRAYVWGVFIASEHRRQGVGKKLLDVTLKYARQLSGLTSVYLSVSEKTPEAKRLYESAGFVVWGLEPDCVRYEGQSVREYHLSLVL